MDISKDTLTSLRKYLYEYVVITLCLAVGFLFKMYTSLNNGFNEHLKEDSKQMIEVITKNTQAIENLKSKTP